MALWVQLTQQQPFHLLGKSIYFKTVFLMLFGRDIIQCLGNKIKPALSQMQELNLCLSAALNSKEKTVVDAAKWVLNLLK